ncbi:hypothetical protein Tco_0904040 [Tanacetum coccineum]
MERGFLSQKGSKVGEESEPSSTDSGYQEKQSSMADKEKSGVAPSAYKDGVAPYVTVASRDISGNGVDVVVSAESIRAISERFANTAYGFFLGKRVAYLIVANYVRNT